MNMSDNALPAFPYFIWISGCCRVCVQRLRMMTLVVGGLTSYAIISSAIVYPHSLAYFNELVGGPENGANHLLNSNIDWGQDLYLLKKWVDEHPEVTDLKLAYFGYFDPAFAGPNYRSPDCSDVDGTGRSATVRPGWYAISVTFIKGLPYFTYKGDGTKVQLAHGALLAFDKKDPVWRAGQSIYVFKIE
jgi:hypothetical protein